MDWDAPDTIQSTGVSQGFTGPVVVDVSTGPTESEEGDPDTVDTGATVLEVKRVSVPTWVLETVVTVPSTTLVNEVTRDADLETVRLGRAGQVTVYDLERETEGVSVRVLLEAGTAVEVQTPETSWVEIFVRDGTIVTEGESVRVAEFTGRRVGENPTLKEREGERLSERLSVKVSYADSETRVVGTRDSEREAERLKEGVRVSTYQGVAEGETVREGDSEPETSTVLVYLRASVRVRLRESTGESEFTKTWVGTRVAKSDATSTTVVVVTSIVIMVSVTLST